MNCRPEQGGCWYCQTDFDSVEGWLESCEFDTVMHVECLVYEFNEKGPNEELIIIMRELGFMLVD